MSLNANAADSGGRRLQTTRSTISDRILHAGSTFAEFWRTSGRFSQSAIQRERFLSSSHCYGKWMSIYSWTYARFHGRARLRSSIWTYSQSLSPRKELATSTSSLSVDDDTISRAHRRRRIRSGACWPSVTTRIMRRPARFVLVLPNWSRLQQRTAAQSCVQRRSGGDAIVALSPTICGPTASRLSTSWRWEP